MDKTGYQVLKIRDFRYFLIARLFFFFGIQMQTVIVGWQIYKYTHDAFALGLIGLAEAIPFLITSLYGGSLADRMDRKRIMITAVSVYLFCVLALLLLSLDFKTVFALVGTLPIYAVIFISGIGRGFMGPAQTALMAQLVPRQFYVYSSTFNSTIWDIATITGPAVGGLIYGFTDSEFISYSAVFICCLIGFFCFLQIEKKPMPEPAAKKEPLKVHLLAGAKYVLNNQVMLGAMALDMFAVLFGGAIALLPAFADQVFHLGATGLGIMRAAPSVGAVIMALFITVKPIRRHAGKKLLFSVAAFGLTWIFFALSKNFYLSVFLLALGGMFDNVSVVIRYTVLQLYTSDDMRGRVSAINGIFIGSSNEIGAFESGLATRLFGLEPSVIFGAIMTLLIVGITWRLAPKLKNLTLE